MNTTFFRAPALRDQLALDGMDRKQIGDLLEEIRHRTPNRFLIPPYVVDDAARALKWSGEDVARAYRAAIKVAR